MQSLMPKLITSSKLARADPSLADGRNSFELIRLFKLHMVNDGAALLEWALICAEISFWNKAGGLFKWPKFKTRPLYESPGGGDYDNVLAPKNQGKKSRATKARGSSHPPGWTGGRPPVSSSGEESSVPPKIDWGNSAQIIADIEKDLDDIIAESERREMECRQFTGASHGFGAFYRTLPTSSLALGRPLLCTDSTAQQEYESIMGCEPLYSSNHPHLIWSPSSKGKGEAIGITMLEGECVARQ